MQLLIILAMLLYGGKNKNILEEVTPVLESFGGEEVKEALKNAQEITQVLNAVREFTGTPAKNADSFADPVFNQHGAQNPDVSFPLAPISAVADKDITYSLSKYISSVN